MATRQYIGARYVPKFYENSVDGSAQWEANVVYSPLTFVTLTNAHMYISKKQVPATIGTPASNPTYWLDVGSYNGFIEELQNEIDEINNVTLPNAVNVLKNSDFIDSENPPVGLTALQTGDSVDNTSALQALINYCSANRKILVLHGIYGVSGTITLKSSCNIMGVCGDYANRDVEDQFTFPCTIIKRIGSSTDPVIQTDPNTRVTGITFKNVGVYGNNVSTCGIRIYRMTNSTFDNVSITDINGTGLYLKPNGTTISDDNIMFNTFTHFFINRVVDGIHLEENDHGNPFDNFFGCIRCDVTHICGIFEGGDNNVFQELSAYQRGSNADPYAWYFKGQFMSNTFYHIGGVIKAEDSTVNSVYEIDNENSGNMPVVASTAKLFYTSNSRHGNGTTNIYPMRNINVQMDSCRGVNTNADLVGSNWNIIGMPSNGAHLAIGIDGTDRRAIIAFSGDGSAGSNILGIDKRAIFLDGHKISYQEVGTFTEGDILLFSDPATEGYIGKVIANNQWVKFGKLDNT